MMNVPHCWTEYQLTGPPHSRSKQKTERETQSCVAKWLQVHWKLSAVSDDSQWDTQSLNTSKLWQRTLDVRCSLKAAQDLAIPSKLWPIGTSETTNDLVTFHNDLTWGKYEYLLQWHRILNRHNATWPPKIEQVRPAGYFWNLNG